MACVKSVMDTIEKNSGKINPNYDITLGAINEIRRNGEDSTDLICTAFSFGYIQGAKAAKAKQKGGAIA